MKSLSDDGSIKQPWGEDLERRRVTNLREERKRFHLIATQLDLGTKMLSFCDNKNFPSFWALNDLLGVSSTSMDVDPSSVSGETELNAYMRVQQLSNDTDPLVWCKQHQQETSEVPTLRPYGQAVPGCACERLFSSVGL